MIPVRVALLALALGLAAAYVAAGASHPWDFETYYYAASAYRAGLDPYQLQSLTAVAGRPIELPFLYPPITLLLFLPLVHLPFGTASLVWLSLKCALAGFLLWIWRKEFLRSVPPDLILVVTLLGFDLALLWDLRTGNIALVEQVLLWLGLSAYARGRFSIAGVLIALASVFKIGPIIFLALFLAPLGQRSRVVPIALGLVTFATLVVVPLAPLASWAHALTAAFGRGPLTPNTDPSAPAVLGWALSLAATPPSAARWVHASLYGLFVTVVISVSVAALRRADRTYSPAERIVAAMVLWFLVSPRVMVYSYVSAVVPALFVLDRTIQGQARRLGAVLLLLLPGFIRFLPGQPPAWLGAISFLTLLATWILWVQRSPSESAHAL